MLHILLQSFMRVGVPGMTTETDVVVTDLVNTL